MATEVEPNNTPATANVLTLSNGAALIQGNIYGNADVDYYQFTGSAGDRVYSAVVTSGSANSSTDSQLTLLASDGTTVIEFDEDDGSLGGLSSSIAGATLPGAGTYYLKVNHFSATNQLRYYRLYLQLRSGSPQAEVESNDTPATANPLTMIPSGATTGFRGGWVSGARNPAAATEQDWYSMTLNAGDTVYLSLDLDPERDNVQWNGRLGLALFGDAGNQILVVDDNSTGSATNPLSETFVMTVKDAGTYFAFVDSASPATGGPTATYHLNVTIIPRPAQAGLCTTYTSTDIPKTLGPGTGLTSSTITIPGNPRIEHLTVGINLTHALMQDLDVHLRSPAGNDNGLFTDIGAAATGGQTQMDVVFDDDAAIPPAFTVLKGLRLAPELGYRLGWFKGENAGGTWTLDLRDDGANVSGGTLNSWSIEVCEPPPPPVCATGFTPTTVFSTNFESGAAGFTSGGAGSVGDQWALGTPNTAATTTANPIADFTTCNSGVNCWKTNLNGTYNVSTVHELISPNINLAGLSAPVVVSWAHRYQMENASFDHYFVDVQQVGGASPVRAFEWLDATMTDVPGNPSVNVPASAGWAVMTARADSLAGLNTELRFHVDADNTVNFGGVAIDDVSVTACRPLSADLSITKTDGLTTAVPGGSVTYTITASNAGPDPVTGATVADTFPAILTATWTCVGAGGGTCTAAGSGNINDSVNLPAGGSVTYTVSATISASATGTLSNTATVSSSIADPVPGNNSATDTDTLAPQANLAITKTDGVTTAAPGGSVTYTITASNAGPSNAPGATVADTFPASLTGTWTCVGAGGGTCTAAGSGNINDTVNLPAGGSVTYTVSATINAAATGTLSNTATVTAPASVTDPTPGNNSATDTDTLLAQANLGITVTDGVTSVVPGSAVTYTIVASNAGPSNAPGSTVADTLPASLTGATWTCVGAGGGACTAAGIGNINDTVNLPAGGSVTYTVTATLSAAATGTLTNMAAVAAAAGVTDPVSGNNSATDTDVITPQADLAITKTDSVTSATPGGTVTYTIVASNAGPNAASGSTVTDTLPATLTGAIWTCVGAGGGTCTAAGSGNINDTVNLPVGGSVTYTLTATVSASATGTLANTATVATPAGITDPTPGNNSATDTDTLTAQANVGIAIADAPDPVVAGGNVTYTITTTNAGPSNAAAVAISLPLGANTTFVSVTAPMGTTCTTPAVGASGTVNCSVVADLAPSASVLITVVVNVNAAFSGSISATAVVSSTTADPTPGNNSATATTTVNPSTVVVTGVASTSGGFITCVSPVSIGSTTTCTVVPGAGSAIVSVTGCGGTLGPGGVYTTAPITAACTVTAAFTAVVVPALQPELLIALGLLLGITGWSVRRK